VYPDYLKSFYSAYGVGVAEVTAPGGDSIFGRTPEAPNGRVLSTWPPNKPCTRSVKEFMGDPEEPTVVYCYLQGTSMAGPHAVGVAALIISMFGDAQNPQNGKMRPGAVAAYLQQTADPQECPTTVPPGYASFVTPTGEPQACQGGPGYNSWYGNGQVDALNAVTHTPSNQ
jgi:subtilisin family serine protease